MVNTIEISVLKLVSLVHTRVYYNNFTLINSPSNLFSLVTLFLSDEICED